MQKADDPDQSGHWVQRSIKELKEKEGGNQSGEGLGRRTGSHDRII